MEHKPTDPFSKDYLEDDRDPSAASTIYVGVVGTLLLAAIIYWLTAVYHRTATEEAFVKQVLPAPAEREAVKAAEADKLSSYGWVSQPDGVARIPIERAMELVVSERAGQGH